MIFIAQKVKELEQRVSALEEIDVSSHELYPIEKVLFAAILFAMGIVVGILLVMIFNHIL